MTFNRILITGGTGFLGGCVVRRLVAASYKVRVLARKPDAVNFPESVEVIRGDLERPESLDAAIEGCDAVMHMASLVKMWAKDPLVFDRINVEGTAHMIRLAKKHAVKKFIYTSSFMAVGPSTYENRPVSETDPYPETHRPLNSYERTKFLADIVARQAGREGFPIVRLYPGVIYGPGLMSDGNLVLQTVYKHLQGKLPGVLGKGDLQWSYAFVEDVAEGHVLALEKGKTGQRYFLGGDNRTMWELYSLVQKWLGTKMPSRIPFFLAKGVGLMQFLRAELGGPEPELTHHVVEIFKHQWALSSDKASRELGYKVTPLEVGLRKSLEWLNDEMDLNLTFKDEMG